jgi:hypothetical protein
MVTINVIIRVLVPVMLMITVIWTLRPIFIENASAACNKNDHGQD